MIDEEPPTQDEIEQALMKLYSLGLVEMEYDENLEATFRITDQGKFEVFMQALKEGLTD